MTIIDENQLPLQFFDNAPNPHRVRAFEKATGWKLSRTSYGDQCWHWIKRRKCDNSCVTRSRPFMLDHCMRATTDTKERVMLSQSYQFTMDDAQELTGWCNDHGLSWACNGFSHYWPNKTTSLVIMNRTANPEIHLPWPDHQEGTATNRNIHYREPS